MALNSSPPAPSADAARLFTLLERFAEIGATPAGGVTRLAASSEDRAARALFGQVAESAGARLRMDAVGNQFAQFPLCRALVATPIAVMPLVMMGSHLDSQKSAGRFDGSLGVATALCVGAALIEARQSGQEFNADFVAVNWTNEEGARFRHSLLGSGAYAGAFSTEYALSRQDDWGNSLGDALAAIGQLGNDPPPLPACYLELHVEQGSVLEASEASIGVVRRSWGALKIDARFVGEQAHTGPTLMERRRDALAGAAHAILGLRDMAARWPRLVHTSVARILVDPNSANVVPASVTISVEIRAGETKLLKEAGKAAEAILDRAALYAGVTYEMAARSERPVRNLPDGPALLVRHCAREAGLTSLDMDTVAGHDALSLLGLCPTGLIFVPSIGGITHNEREDTAPGDIAAGLKVSLLAASWLCRAGGEPEAALSLCRSDET